MIRLAADRFKEKYYNLKNIYAYSKPRNKFQG